MICEQDELFQCLELSGGCPEDRTSWCSWVQVTSVSAREKRREAMVSCGVPWLLTWAVLVYAPTSGRAGSMLPTVSRALKQAVRARGDEVVDGAIERAKQAHRQGWVPQGELA